MHENLKIRLSHGLFSDCPERRRTDEAGVDIEAVIAVLRKVSRWTGENGMGDGKKAQERTVIRRFEHEKKDLQPPPLADRNALAQT